MNQDGTITIRRLANGWEVHPESGSCYAPSDIFVFNEWTDLVQWLGQHFVIPYIIQTDGAQVRVDLDMLNEIADLKKQLAEHQRINDAHRASNDAAFQEADTRIRQETVASERQACFEWAVKACLDYSKEADATLMAEPLTGEQIAHAMGRKQAATTLAELMRVFVKKQTKEKP